MAARCTQGREAPFPEDLGEPGVADALEGLGLIGEQTGSKVGDAVFIQVVLRVLKESVRRRAKDPLPEVVIWLSRVSGTVFKVPEDLSDVNATVRATDRALPP